MSEADYREGWHQGVQWAEQDRAAGLDVTHDELDRMRYEAHSNSRWARAFYLGALRGYRETVRTLCNGRWGT